MQPSTSGNDQSLIELLKAEVGADIDLDTISRIKQLLSERKPATPVPPPPTFIPLTTAEPSPTSQTYQPAQTDIPIGNPYSGTRGTVPGVRSQSDANRLALPNNRWGTHTPSPPRAEMEGSTTPTPQAPHPAPITALDLLQQVTAADEASSEGGWTPHKMVRDWAKGVTPETPPPLRSATSDPPSLTNSLSGPAEEIGIGGLAVSEVGSVDTDLPTPGKRDSPVPPQEAEVDVSAPVPTAPPPPSTYRTDDRRTVESADGEDRRPPRQNRVAWERSEVPWKRAPHPAYSNLFAERRILIR